MGNIFIQIDNRSSLNVNVEIDVEGEAGYAPDNFLGWLRPNETTVYFPNDGYLNSPAVGYEPGDTIEGVAIYNPNPPAPGLAECATDIEFTKAYFFEVFNDPDTGGVRCVDLN